MKRILIAATIALAACGLSAGTLRAEIPQVYAWRQAKCCRGIMAITIPTGANQSPWSCRQPPNFKRITVGVWAELASCPFITNSLGHTPAIMALGRRRTLHSDSEPTQRHARVRRLLRPRPLVSKKIMRSKPTDCNPWVRGPDPSD